MSEIISLFTVFSPYLLTLALDHSVFGLFRALLEMDTHCYRKPASELETPPTSVIHDNWMVLEKIFDKYPKLP